MGVIRMLLALAVVCGHTGTNPLWQGPGSEVAVQAFFLLSGFCIAMALGHAYHDANLNFWVNRALRIYPLYLVVALIALLGKYWTQPGFFADFAGLPGAAKALLTVSSLAIVGQDWVLFVGVRDDALAFFTDATTSTPVLNALLPNPPAWSLATLLGFYLLAPFLFKLRSWALLLIVGASLALRLVLASQGLVQAAWSYAFFWTELAVFLAGGLAYRAMPMLRRLVGPVLFQTLAPYATWLVVALILVYAELPGGTDGAWKATAFYLAVLVCLPFIFTHCRSSRLDRVIGNLSYPLYISHWVTLAYLQTLFGVPQGPLVAALYVLATLAVATLLYRMVDRPLQRLRDLIRAATVPARARTREPWPTTSR